MGSYSPQFWKRIFYMYIFVLLLFAYNIYWIGHTQNHKVPQGVSSNQNYMRFTCTENECILNMKYENISYFMKTYQAGFGVEWIQRIGQLFKLH